MRAIGFLGLAILSGAALVFVVLWLIGWGYRRGHRDGYSKAIEEAYSDE